MATVGRKFTGAPEAWDTIPANKKYVSGHWNIPPASISGMSAYLRNSTGGAINVRLVLYSADPTFNYHWPGDLLGYTNTISIPAGSSAATYTANMTTTLTLSTPTNVYMGIHAETSGVEIGFDAVGSFKLRYQGSGDQTDTWSDGPSARFDTHEGAVSDDSHMLFCWVNYTSTEGAVRMIMDTRGTVYVDGDLVIYGGATGDNDGEVWKTGSSWPPTGTTNVRLDTSTVNELAPPGSTSVEIPRNYAIRSLESGVYKYGQIINRFDTSQIPAGAGMIRGFVKFDSPGNGSANESGITSDYAVEWMTDGNAVSTSDYSSTISSNAALFTTAEAIAGYRIFGLSNIGNILKAGHTKLRVYVNTHQTASVAPLGTNYITWGGVQYGGGNELIVDYVPVPGSVVRGFQKTDVAPAATSATVALPAGVQAGDLLIMVTSTGTNNVRNPVRSGQLYGVPNWTCLADLAELSEDSRITVHAKIAVANEPNPVVTFQQFVGPLFSLTAVAMVYAFSSGFDSNLANIIHASYDPSQGWYARNPTIYVHVVNPIDDTNHPGVEIETFNFDELQITPPITTTQPCTIMHIIGADVLTANFPSVMSSTASPSDGSTLHDAHYYELPSGENPGLGIALYNQTAAGTHTTFWQNNKGGHNNLLWGFAIKPSASTPPPPPPPPPPPSQHYGLYNYFRTSHGDTGYQIGSATSPDTITWTRGIEPTIARGTGWESVDVAQPYMVVVGTTLYCYYSGYSGNNNAIGLARSTDNGATWSKYSGNPVIPATQGFEGTQCYIPAVLYDTAEVDANKRFKIWYAANGGAAIGYASSPDGITWTKKTTPVLTPTGSGWEQNLISPQGVINLAGTYYLYYAGYGDSGSNYPVSVGLVTFTDPLGTYTRAAGNPLLSPDGKKTTLTAQCNVNDTTLAVADSSAFPIGCPIWIFDNSGHRFLSSVVSAGMGGIGLADAAPTVVLNGGAVNSVCWHSVCSSGPPFFDGVNWRQGLVGFKGGDTGGLNENSMQMYSSALNAPWSIDYSRGLTLPVPVAESVGTNYSTENLAFIDLGIAAPQPPQPFTRAMARRHHMPGSR